MMQHGGEQPVAAVLNFWFGEAPEDAAALERKMKRWFGVAPEFDAEIRERFEGLVEAATRGALEDWHATAQGQLALVLLLDQFRRNLFRRSAAAFAGDAKALEVCEAGLASGSASRLRPLERAFLCMPLQHAESLDAQRRSVAAFDALAAVPAPPHVRDCLRGFAESAHEHHAIIERFGRFPHRNEALGRASTREEIDYLEGGGARFGQ